jgi:hypothetical protein
MPEGRRSVAEDSAGPNLVPSHEDPDPSLAFFCAYGPVVPEPATMRRCSVCLTCEPFPLDERTPAAERLLLASQRIFAASWR